MDNIKQKLGLKIKKLRQSRNLKQSELAEKVGVEDKTISRIEVGGNYPSMDLLIRIANTLEYDLTEFFKFQDATENTFSELSVEEINTVKKFINLLSEKLNL